MLTTRSCASPALMSPSRMGRPKVSESYAKHRHEEPHPFMIREMRLPVHAVAMGSTSPCTERKRSFPRGPGYLEGAGIGCTAC